MHAEFLLDQGGHEQIFEDGLRYLQHAPAIRIGALREEYDWSLNILRVIKFSQVFEKAREGLISR